MRRSRLRPCLRACPWDVPFRRVKDERRDGCFVSSEDSNYWTIPHAKGLDSGCMRPLFHPSIEEITVEAILHALADPVRVALYAEIVASACPRSCSSLM